METRSRRRQGNKTVKVEVAKRDRSKKNDLGKKGNVLVCKDVSEMSAAISKGISKRQDVLKNDNKQNAGEKAISGAQTIVKLQELKKRKKSTEEKCHIRKVAKKDSEMDTAPLCTSGKDSTLHLSNEEIKNDLQKLQKGKSETEKNKGILNKTRKTSNYNSPSKPNIKKLRQIATLVQDQEISLLEEKTPMKRNQTKEESSDDLLVRSGVLNNQDGAEDFKKKGKSPVKVALKGKSSYSMKNIMMDSQNSADDGDDSEMEWEDVAEADVRGLEHSDSEDKTCSLGDSKSPSTSSNVEVTIKVPGKKKRDGKNSQEEIRKWFQRRKNQIKKESQICAHKVHLLALLANGLHRNDLCNNSILQGIGLSLVPNQFTQRSVSKAWDISFLTRVATWFKNKVPNPGDIHTGHSEGTYLMRVLEKKVYFFVVILRALGLSVRLVMSLQILDIKVNDGGKYIGATKLNDKQNKSKEGKHKQVVKKEQKKPSPKENLLNRMKGKSAPKKKVTGSSSATGKTLRKRLKVDYTINSDSTESEYFKENSTESDYFKKDKKRASGDSSAANFSHCSDDEDDFEIASVTPRTGRISSKELNRRNHEVEENPQDVGENSSVLKRGIDLWAEVYLEKEEKWICIDGDTYTVNQPEECEKYATKPIKYIVAFDDESCVKDVTARYASCWLTNTSKQRVDPEWWTDTLSFYKTNDLKSDKKEDSLIKANLRRKPLPTSVTEYKNHPLYVLKRHLLKYEAIYPETAATLGFCRGEAVYSRDCVHTLHTRELWMKEAMVVKSGEKFYKIVKGRKSKRKMLENVGDITAELFGKWQTEEYVPPPVIDGKIPRNEYGNVELFKPSMLPLGTCHIQVPGIHRLARKLEIDAVQAVVGFEFHAGFSHPVIDGVVVCEENKDVLLDAWNNEQKEKIKREEEKREKRVLGNWRHLVRSLRIRERLKRKYNMEDEPDVAQEEKEVKQNSDETEDVTDICLSWPLNRQEGKSTRADNGHCHVFLEANHHQDPITGEWNKICSCGLKEPLEKSLKT